VLQGLVGSLEDYPVDKGVEGFVHDEYDDAGDDKLFGIHSFSSLAL
jgi:hypothetical protein